MSRPKREGHVPPRSNVPPTHMTVGPSFRGPGARTPPTRPFGLPYHAPWLVPPDEQIRHMIEQRERELEQLRELQRRYVRLPTPPLAPPTEPTDSA